MRNLNSTEAQRKHENHQGRPELTNYSETKPQEIDEQGGKKPPVHSTEHRSSSILQKKRLFRSRQRKDRDEHFLSSLVPVLEIHNLRQKFRMYFLAHFPDLCPGICL